MKWRIYYRMPEMPCYEWFCQDEACCEFKTKKDAKAYVEAHSEEFKDCNVRYLKAEPE